MNNIKNINWHGDDLDLDDEESLVLLSGNDYPWVCEQCQAIIDSIRQMYLEDQLGDTDDPEAAIMFAYDHRMMCGGHSCANPPNTEHKP